MSRIVYFDCASGASGDMLLGAVVDLGLPIDRLREELAKLAAAGLPDRGAPCHEERPRRHEGRRRGRGALARAPPPAAHPRAAGGLDPRGRREDARGGAVPPPRGSRGRRARELDREGPLPRGRRRGLDRGHRRRGDRAALARSGALRGFPPQRRDGHGDDVARDVPGPAPGHGEARGRRAGLRGRRGRASDPHRRPPRDGARHGVRAVALDADRARPATGPGAGRRRAGRTCCA